MRYSLTHFPSYTVHKNVEEILAASCLIAIATLCLINHLNVIYTYMWSRCTLAFNACSWQAVCLPVYLYSASSKIPSHVGKFNKSYSNRAITYIWWWLLEFKCWQYSVKFPRKVPSQDIVIKYSHLPKKVILLQNFY